MSRLALIRILFFVVSLQGSASSSREAKLNHQCPLPDGPAAEELKERREKPPYEATFETVEMLPLP